MASDVPVLISVVVALLVMWLHEAAQRRRAEAAAHRYFEKWRDEVEAGHRYYMALAAMEQEERDGE